MKRVVIVQEYVPDYRAPFFGRLQSSAASKGIDVVVAAGTPNQIQAARRDATALEGLRAIAQHEYRVFGQRITVRDISPAIHDADFLILEQARRNIDAYRILSGRRAPKPTALWGHGRDYTHTPGAVRRAAYNWLTRRADWFFAYTEGGKDAVVSLGYPANRVTVVQNSIDTSELTHAIVSLDASDISAYTQALDLRGKTALFIGGMDDSKRMPFLLDAAQQVSEGDPDFRLLVAGAGNDAALVKNALPHSSWLRYLGPVVGADKALALTSAQVLAMPGRVGLVAVDSFAAGVPIVTTDWPWHAPEFEYLRDGVNAMVSCDTVQHYASALVEVLNDPLQRSRLSLGAVHERDRYTVDRMAERYSEGLLRWQASPRR